MKDQLLREIVLMEWEMFQNVSNVGGKAPCQQNQKTFSVMRVSQAMSWTKPMLESYLEDLRLAEKQGRNLLAEKYARMMEDTFPEEYKNLESQLPPLSDEVISLAERITALMVHWAKEAREKYPRVVGAGRPIVKGEVSRRDTSLETYNRGELLTYSIRTLTFCWDYFSQCFIEGTNAYEAILENTVRLYGYESLAQAEADRSLESAGGRFSGI